MQRIGKDNNVKKGFLSYPAFVETLMEQLNGAAVARAIPDEILKKIKRIVITGNGDSYAAALATREFNSRMFKNRDYQVLRCIDVSRHHVFCDESPDETLVIVISVSGGGSRVTETMMRAAAKGCSTLAVTGNPQSRMAQEARYVLPIPVPKATEFSPAHQTKSYFTAVLTTITLGLHAGLLLGSISESEIQPLREEILRYVRAVCNEAVLSRVDEQMEHLADTWKDYLGYDFVGAGSDFATAYFGCAKFFELCGSLNCLNDSEDWCHIDYFQTKREQLGTIAVASRNCASFSRTVETIGSMQLSQRNVLVVSDAEANAFIDGVTVCTLPPAKYEAVNPLMNFIPLFMLANYIALKRNYEYFGGMDERNPLFSQDGGINTIKSSKIVYID